MANMNDEKTDKSTLNRFITGGALILERSKRELTPALMKAEFLAWNLATGHSIFDFSGAIVPDEERELFRTGDTTKIDGTQFSVSLVFPSPKLYSVLLFIDVETDEIFSSWEPEKERYAKHEAWLEKNLGATEKTFAWGRVRNYYDEVNIGAAIQVIYCS